MYPLESDLSGEYRHPAFKQPVPELWGLSSTNFGGLCFACSVLLPVRVEVSLLAMMFPS